MITCPGCNKVITEVEALIEYSYKGTLHNDATDGKAVYLVRASDPLPPLTTDIVCRYCHASLKDLVLPFE